MELIDPEMVIRNDDGLESVVKFVKMHPDGWIRVRDAIGGEFDIPRSAVVDCESVFGDPHTLCGSPRCSLGEGHTVSCDELAQPPA